MIHDTYTPEAAQRLEERRELFRMAAQRLLDDVAAGRKTDPEALQWARQIVKTHKPLGRPLSTGEPLWP